MCFWFTFYTREQTLEKQAVLNGGDDEHTLFAARRDGLAM